MDASEISPDGLLVDQQKKSWIPSYRYSRQFKTGILSAEMEDNDDGRHDGLQGTPGGEVSLIRIWRKLIENYTKRALTQESDRLPAVDGMAKTMESAVKDRCVGGLWKQQLLQDLTWHINQEPVGVNYKTLGSGAFGLKQIEGVTLPPRLAYKPRSTAVPSWSWSKVGHGVTWRHTMEPQHGKELVELAVIDAEVSLKDGYEDRIRLRGTLRPALAMVGDEKTP